MTSDPSKLVVVDKASSLSKVKFDPSDNYSGQTTIDFDQITEGSQIDLQLKGQSSPFGTIDSYPLSWYNNFDVQGSLGRALQAGDEVQVTPTLCSGGSTTTSTPVKECDELPAPKIVQPTGGETSVTVRKAASGAKIRVFGGGGDVIGFGYGHTIPLDRAVLAGETIEVVQHVGDCRGKSAWQVDVAEATY